MNLRSSIQPISSIPPTAKLTERAVMKVVVVAADAVWALALYCQLIIGLAKVR
jgi:hypothetical protein